MDSLFSGKTPICPVGKEKTRGLPCASRTKICRSGECLDSICSLFNSSECVPDNNVNDAKSLCLIYCKLGKRCLPMSNHTLKLIEFETSRSKGDRDFIKKRPGDLCNRSLGYCDSLRRCRLQIPHGSLPNIRKFLVGTGPKSLHNFMRKKWWLFSIITLVPVGFFFLLFYIFDVDVGKIDKVVDNMEKAINIPALSSFSKLLLNENDAT